MISSKNIDKIFETLQIEEVIEDFVTLKPSGSNLLGLCPFHDEKTPSFSVSPSKGIFKCFGCGKGGNAIQFLMDHENFTYPEALRYVAEKYGIQIEEAPQSEEEQEEQKKRESLYIVNEFARKFYAEQLLETGEGQSVGLEYFESRGYGREIIKKFDLGYAPRSGNSLKRAALVAGHEIERLEALGLISSRGSDFFRERVMFSIHNLSGKPVAFAGRMIGNQQKGPKYINSPESEIYTKSNVLYGIFQARQRIREEDKCLLVEGYTDVISLHKAGIENVVAVSGTSLTPGQIKLVKRFSKNITLIFDGDTAGKTAADRSIDLLLEQDMNIRIVMLETEDDPDSAVERMGAEEFLAYINEREKDFLQFKIDYYYDASDSDAFQKTEAIREVVKSIGKINDQLPRSLFISRAAGLLDIDEKVLISEVNKVIRDKLWREKGQRRRKERIQEQGETSESSKESPSQGMLTSQDYYQEEALAALLLKYGNELMEEEISVHEFVFENLEDVYDEITDPTILKVLGAIQQSIEKHGEIKVNQLVASEDQLVSKMVVHLISEQYSFSENWKNRWNIILQNQQPPDENYQSEAEQVVISLKLRKVRKVIKQLMEELSQAQAQSLKDTDERLEMFLEYKKLETTLAEKLRTIVY